MNALPTRLLPLLAAAAILTACSKSSSPAPSAAGGGGGATQQIPLVFDTTWPAEVVDARVLAVAVEDGAGQLFAEALAAPAPLRIGDPGGTPSGLVLRIPTGRGVRAAWLMLEPNAVTTAGGARVTPPRYDLRIPFRGNGEWSPAAGTLATVEHGPGHALQSNGNGGFDWSPDLRLAGRTTVTCTAMPADVMLADPAAGTLTALLPTIQDLPVEVVFQPGARFFRADGTEATQLAAYLAGLAPGARIVLRGELSADRVLRCSQVGAPGGGGGGGTGGGGSGGGGTGGGGNAGPGTFGGTVTAVDAPGQRLTVSFQTLTQQGSTIASPRGSGIVEVAGATIHWSGLPNRPVTIAAIDVGQALQLDTADVGATPIRADRIELELVGGGQQTGEVEGLIAQVDPVAGLIVLVPRGNDPVVVLGRSVPRLEVLVDANTRIEDRDGNRLTLAQVPTGVRGDVERGVLIAPDQVLAQYVEVRIRDR